MAGAGAAATLCTRKTLTQPPPPPTRPPSFDEGSTISWIPCGRKLTCSYPGIKFFYGPDTYYGEEVSVLEMDGAFDKLEELIYVESHLSNTSSKFYGEVTQQARGGGAMCRFVCAGLRLVTVCRPFLAPSFDSPPPSLPRRC